MADEYLWDRTGEPDTDVEHWEGLLQRFRYKEPPRPRKSRVVWKYVVASGAIAASIAALVFYTRPAESAWQVTMAGGAPRRVAMGEMITTPASAGAKLESSFVGEVRLEPNSRLRVIRSTEQQERLSLQRGTLHAVIWAPPEKFVVDTPSAKTIDLGCAYTLRVERDGSGFLKVTTGWVAFQAGPAESFIPAGASCSTAPKRGPGLPYFDDASAVFVKAVQDFDRRSGGVAAILENARRKDGLTLWHLLQRTSGAARLEVADRFVQLIPAVDAASLRRGDSAAVDAAWNALDLGNTEWWRTWKRNWN